MRHNLLLRTFGWFWIWVFFKIKFGSKKNKLSRIKLPVYCASNIINQFQLKSSSEMTECSLIQSVVNCKQEVQMAPEDYSVDFKTRF